MLVAGAFLLLHTFVPHEHNTDIKAAETFTLEAPGKSLIDYIRLALYFDQGEHHLEEYNPVESFTIDIILFPTEEIKFTFQLPVTLETDKGGFNPKESIPDPPFNDTDQYRGPPCIG